MSAKKDPVFEIEENFHEDDELAQLKESLDIDKLRSLLNEGEVVYRLVLCYRAGSDGVLAATNQRVVFVDKKFVTTDVESYDYGEIAAIVYREDLVTHTLTLAHTSRPLTLEKIDREHGDRFLAFIHKAIGADYTIEGDGHVFKHNDDMLQIEDVPSMTEEEISAEPNA